MYKSPKGASTGKKKELKYSKKQLLRCEGKTSLIYFPSKFTYFIWLSRITARFYNGSLRENILSSLTFTTATTYKMMSHELHFNSLAKYLINLNYGQNNHKFSHAIHLNEGTFKI